MYASFPYPVHKVKENVIIKEHLCCKKFTACLNLFLKTINIIKLILGILSELSKLLIMAILFRRQIIYYLFGLLVMIFLRCTMGGLHFYRYSQCLLASIIYIWLSIIVMPHILIYKYVEIILMIFSILICYYIGPLPSKYRPQYSKQYLTKMRLFTSKFIFLYTLILYIIPRSKFLSVGFWIIILHSLQLVIAKILSKGEKNVR